MSTSHISGGLVVASGGVTATTGDITATAGNVIIGTDKLPASATLAIAAGATNVSIVTITVKDGAGVAMARAIPLDIWLSDAATGLGVTATTASGAVAAGTAGTDLVDLTSKKVKRVITDATGVYKLSITDTAKTGFYVAAAVPSISKIFVSSQLQTASYG
jgi:protocatechuate 3,4-dioxygenase beta subunit